MYSRFLGVLLLNWLLGFSLIVTSLVAMPVSAKLINPSTQTILVFGDSLSASYGLSQGQGWVALLEAKLAQNQASKTTYKVVNASISGETTSGGLARFSTALTTHKPNIVILELGANDGLRGLPIAEMQANLNQMIAQAKTAKAKVLLIGMKIPPNYGLKYSRDFSASYTVLAKQHKLKLVPFLLDGVAGKPRLIQDDGLHPTATAQPVLLNNVWAQLKDLLK
jgi:acyl-CoA thioesterase I